MQNHDQNELPSYYKQMWEIFKKAKLHILCSSIEMISDFQMVLKIKYGIFF